MGKKNRIIKTVVRSEAQTKPLENLDEPTYKPWIKWVLPPAIVFITLLVFIPAFSNGFVNIDDGGYIVSNKMLAKPIGECLKYFFARNYVLDNYHPLTMVIYSIIYHISGLNPVTYHVVSIIIHLLNVLLVFWFIYLLSGKRLEVAAIVSLFFGIHPMHVESVAWVSELKDVLYTFFFIGGLICYYKYIDRSLKRNWTLYLGTFLLFIFSCFSKSAAVTFPLILLLIDFFKKRKINKTVWLEKIPFLLVSLIFGMINVSAQTHAIIDNERYNTLHRFMLASYGMLSYLVKLIFPVNLAHMYPLPYMSNGHLPVIFYIAPFIVLLIFFLVYRTLKYSRLITFGILFFFLNIALVLQFMPFGRAITADRYTYVPYIGLFFLIAMGFSWLYHNKKIKISFLKPALLIVIAATGITSAYFANARCRVWHDSITLRTDGLNKFPGYGYGYYGLGLTYLDSADYKNCLISFKKAVKYNRTPDPDAFNALGYAYQLNDSLEKAIIYLDMALSYWPDTAKFHNNLAYVYFRLKDYDKAIEQYNSSRIDSPNDPDTYINLGLCYKLKKDYDNAISNYEKAKNLSIPIKPSIFMDLGHLYAMSGNYGKTKQNYDSLLMYQPDSAYVHDNLGYALTQEKKYDQAIIEYNKAINMDPKYASTYTDMGLTYMQMKSFEKALKFFNKAIELDSADAQNYLNIALVYHNMGDDNKSKAYFIKANQVENKLQK